ncbi:MAG: hypothetical protein Q8L64_06255 [bacterium]|nr:hypothetical protein [bacterium]
MFNKTFFKFTLAFAAIILIGLVGIILSGYSKTEGEGARSATVDR